MTEREHSLFGELMGIEQRSNWIRLRTMILLRWVAIVGQVSALVVAQRMYNLQLELGLCYLVVGIAIVGNLIAIFVFPENKRLSETENFMMVMFDLLQMCFLLYLTGGLHNPFSLLVLAPVTVSATVLSLRSTIILNGTAFALVSGMVFFHLPLRTGEGFILRIPDVFVFGQWAAITIALVFISVYSRRVTREMHSMSDALTATQMALARAQKLNDLGGVVAAAAHELGTPLATIKLTSAELADDLDDRPDLREDALLIREQADRCRDILRSMGRAGKDDLHMRQAPLVEVIREAAEPHEGRGKAIVLEDGPGPGGEYNPPQILRRPEIIHGLRNLVQNAVDFARTTVWIEALWTDEVVSIRILDDGRGFPPHLLGRIGDPFMRRRKTDADRKQRPEYEGMGLGLFIAKTLLERSGAELSFANGADPYKGGDDSGKRRGAIVEVVWPRGKIVPDLHKDGTYLGENQRFEL
ncbi:sensor histidine kinase RegB [Tropicibacter naphthalenivorans]|uniref:histidine kinase n=1 Tax=Tropicibacter naphthalenivorans TaxID=441103 RepID=A0A0P1GVJ1_9RHOB|nr:ActS/PrrB/RegB family redox-sensitive histidine kinase [Tropicibacter naphthalenivorans]CUH79528.1 Sensor histidine kinase RegB [Tropicibacter naphthalenivorans]SMC73337.1 two-component system, sensor histidine kinase RegB [Tropicibacter naphthalenivorans]